MKNVCCNKVKQKSSRGDTEVGGLRDKPGLSHTGP